VEAADAGLVRDAFAGLAQALDRAPADLEPALATVRDVVDRCVTVTLSLEPGALKFEGETVYREPTGAAGFCWRLHRDGVRTLTFKRGLMMPELLAFAAAAAPEVPESGEDAVSQLWKADLGSIQFTAAGGDPLADHPAAASHAQEVKRIAEEARKAVEHVDSDAASLDRTSPPPLWSEEQRRQADPRSWGDVARRAALTLARIVEHDLAGWDLEALEEAFVRLVDEMARRAEVQALVGALEAAAAMRGEHAPAFRGVLARSLVERSRLVRAVELSAAPVTSAAQVLPAWTALLADDAGPELLEALQGARAQAAPALAAAAARRSGSCGADLTALLRAGPAAAAQAVLNALPAEPEGRRAELASAALEHPDATVRAAAVPLVALDAARAVQRLAPLLDEPELRAAAAGALASCVERAEEAAAAFIERLSAAASAKLAGEELAVLYRSLGRLGSSAGRAFFAQCLARPAPRLLKRRQFEQQQLLAIEGLAEDASIRALRILQEAADETRRLPPAVAAACLAAIERVRTRRQPRERPAR
jgi:hypothetical protein